MKAVPGLISPWVPGRYATLGTDGFGMSGTRPALRRHFRIDAEHIAVAVLTQLVAQGDVKSEILTDAIERYDVDTEPHREDLRPAAPGL
jgi:pyruvate dehydrogenase E1 component